MASAAPRRNPFATRHVRPGAIPFRFPSGIEPHHLVARLRSTHWRGEIVGPHGTGKSTLLAALLPELAAAGRRVVQRQLHQGEKRLPFTWREMRAWKPSTLVVVDGCEQLSWWTRWLLSLCCRLRGAGLLVTAHTPLGFPPLWKTGVSPELAAELVAQLAAGGPLPDPAQLPRLLAAHAGNFRETLFDLYDWHEQHRG